MPNSFTVGEYTLLFDKIEKKMSREEALALRAECGHGSDFIRMRFGDWRFTCDSRECQERQEEHRYFRRKHAQETMSHEEFQAWERNEKEEDADPCDGEVP
jgi:chromosome condensin MukBEF MukE localization factor